MFREGSKALLGGVGDVLALCAVIFFADASHSAVIPIFPFYASSLGATIMTIGALASASGFSRMACSIPLGLLSDRMGRKRVMLLGMLCFVLAPVIYSASSSPIHLFPARVILGFGMASTFSIGFVYVSEVAPFGRRSLFQGIYMTSMGVGFTLGPLVGGLFAKAWGYASSFYLSSGLAAAGLVLLLFVPEPAEPLERMETPVRPFPGFGRVLTDFKILAAGAANFFNSLIFSATMVYFPLYGGSVGLDESEVGMSLTVRGLASTFSRIPTGAAVLRLGALRLMALGLGLTAATLLVLPSFESLLVICLVLGFQGVAYGVFLTSGNVYVTEEAPASQRGAGMGIYSTFSNISGVVSPLILGVASEAWGFKGAFLSSAVIAICGAALALALSSRGQVPTGCEPL
jgi:DHA1 family multidrug resistance protein-like MFS transporter